MAQSPIVVVATDELERSITIAMSNSSRIEYFLGDRYYRIKNSIDKWIADEWHNYVVSQLTKSAVSIEVQRSQPVTCPPPWESKAMDVQAYLDARALGIPLEEIAKVKYGPPNWDGIRTELQQEDAMSENFRSTPSREYRFTVIAPQANTFHYHRPRRWYKTEDAAKQDAASVFENCNSAFELAVVECKDVFKRKPKVELISTFKRSQR